MSCSVPHIEPVTDGHVVHALADPLALLSSRIALRAAAAVVRNQCVDLAVQMRVQTARCRGLPLATNITPSSGKFSRLSRCNAATVDGSGIVKLS